MLKIVMYIEEIARVSSQQGKKNLLIYLLIFLD